MTKIQQAFQLLNEVPEQQWLIELFTDFKSKCDAIGHFQRLTSSNPEDFSYENCTDRFKGRDLRLLSLQFCLTKGYFYKNTALDIAVINNITTQQYPQETPKQRVLALLKDMIDNGY